MEGSRAFIHMKNKILTFFAKKEDGGAGLILGHLAPVKHLLLIRSILKVAFSANTQLLGFHTYFEWLPYDVLIHCFSCSSFFLVYD